MDDDGPMDYTGGEKSMEHVMVDIETLGTGRDAVIKSIGAVGFDPHAGEVDLNDFYKVICLMDDDFKQGSVTASTLNFWMKQTGDAKIIFKNNWDDIPIQVALALFVRWWQKQKAKYVWSYGSNFDCVILEHWFNTSHIPCPWSYRDIRCARTVLQVAEIDLKSFYNEVQHNALSDAHTQVIAVGAAYEKLGLAKVNQNDD